MECPSCGTEMKAEIAKVNNPDPDEGKKAVVNRECPKCGNRVERVKMSLAEIKRSL